MRILDLFSGIGGFSLAGRWAGCTTVQFVERDGFCQKVLAKNFPGVPIDNDVRTFTPITQVDLVTAGFPCQPFSVAGKRKGKDDERYLWPEVIRIIRTANPDWLILENVPGIIPVLDPILGDLENSGYDWRTFLIPASAIGAPHKRERIWIVANRHGERWDDGRDNRKERPLCGHWNRDLATLYTERPQCVPESWTTFDAQTWLAGNADSVSVDQTDSCTDTNRESGDTRACDSGQSRTDSAIDDRQENKPPIPGMDDGIPNGLDRNKALGNAIVPQIAYILILMIRELDLLKGN